MSSTIFFFFFIPLVSFILLAINLVFAPRNPYMEKNSAFECGFSSFLGQNRTQFSISFFIFALLFLLFDLEILLVYPYLVSAYVNEMYGLVILLVFLLALTIGFVFELGKKALTIDSRQTLDNQKKMLLTNKSKDHNKYGVFNLVIMQSSFMDYNIFNKSFWCAYVVKLKTKFTFNNIVSALLTIIFVYFFRHWLVHSSDWDLSKFTEYFTIGLSTSIFSKIVKSLLEQIFEVNGPFAGSLEKIPMGPSEHNEMGNKTNVKPWGKAEVNSNVFAMEQDNEMGSSRDETNTVSPSQDRTFIEEPYTNQVAMIEKDRLNKNGQGSSQKNKEMHDQALQKSKEASLRVKEDLLKAQSMGEDDVSDNVKTVSNNLKYIKDLESLYSKAPKSKRQIESLCSDPTNADEVKKLTEEFAKSRKENKEMTDNTIKETKSIMRELEKMSNKRKSLGLDHTPGAGESNRPNIYPTTWKKLHNLAGWLGDNNKLIKDKFDENDARFHRITDELNEKDKSLCIVNERMNKHSNPNLEKGNSSTMEQYNEHGSSRNQTNVGSSSTNSGQPQYPVPDNDWFRRECMAKELPVQDEDWHRKESVAKQSGFGQESVTEKVIDLYTKSNSLKNVHYSNYDQETFKDASDSIRKTITDLNEISKKRLKTCLDRPTYPKEYTDISNGLTGDISRDLSPNPTNISEVHSVIKGQRRRLLIKAYYELNAMGKDNSRIGREITKLHESIKSNK